MKKPIYEQNLSELSRKVDNIYTEKNLKLLAVSPTSVFFPDSYNENYPYFFNEKPLDFLLCCIKAKIILDNIKKRKQYFIQGYCNGQRSQHSA